MLEILTVSDLGSPGDGVREVRDVVLHSVVSPALLSSEVCLARTGLGAAGLISQPGPGTVETTPGWWRPVTLPD